MTKKNIRSKDYLQSTEPWRSTRPLTFPIEHLDDPAVQVDTTRGEDKGNVGEVEIANVDLVAVDADIEIELELVSFSKK